MSTHCNNLAIFLSKLTPEPGVYRMLDKENNLLYVGKASNLKKRILSYFNKKNSGAKMQSLVQQIASIEISITRSEKEALLLESNLIKTLQPKYNVLLRDDKSYPYIHISSHPFPRITLYRSKKKPRKGVFYGPYPSVIAVRETLNAIQKIFKLRSCPDSYFNARKRPCLQYQIKRCSAPCTAYISPKEYKQALEDTSKFLEGKSQLILDKFAQRMEQASDNLCFEEAANWRDKIKNLRLIQEQQAIIQTQGDADIIVIKAQPGFACIQYVTVREGQVIANQHFFPSVPHLNFGETENFEDVLWQQVFEAFLAFYYYDFPERIPALILTDKPFDHSKVLQKLLSELRGKSCRIQTTSRGKKAQWVDFALNNLRLSLANFEASSETIQKRYASLGKLLRRETPISHMECFDVSHTQGDSTVASCVVFGLEGPQKSKYRRFNIQGITPGDDYEGLNQAIRRRLKYLLQEKSLPDVLIIDGGKGQVAVAKRILDDLQIDSITLLGIAKGPERKAGYEKLILLTEKQELSLNPDSPALHLLQHIRNEAHRFAITTHRKKRQNKSLLSHLETIEGVGPKRRRALLQRFGGLQELARAPLSEIAKISGINEELAKRIYQFLHSYS